MARQLYYFACLMAIIDLRCQAFKPRSKKYFLSGNGNLLRSHGYDSSWRRSSPLTSLHSIRGGSNEDDVEDDDEYDEDGNSFDDFIASFESELAEIRREAELEAENEMKKIRGLIERRDEFVNDDDEDDDDDEDEEQIEEFIVPEYHGVTVGSNGNDRYEVVDGDSDVAPEEIVGASPHAEETKESTDDSGNVLDVDESINRQGVEQNNGDMRRKEIDEESKDATTGLRVERDRISEISESVDVTMDNTDKVDSSIDDSAVASEMISSSSSSEKKSKAPKKKSKASKTKGRAKVNFKVESDSSKRGRVDVGKSVLLTRTRDRDDEVTPTRQSGIWYYLRSDLGRALCLFIATVIVAILTKRLERQMEAEEVKAHL